jgi:hypothetical protein
VKYGKQKIQEHQTGKILREPEKNTSQNSADLYYRVFHSPYPFDGSFPDTILAGLYWYNASRAVARSGALFRYDDQVGP